MFVLTINYVIKMFLNKIENKIITTQIMLYYYNFWKTFETLF